MKKLVLVSVIFLSLLAVTILSNALREGSSCKYDSKFDQDGDYVMNKDADCDPYYVYDCNDNNKDIFKGCAKTLWQKIVDFFTGGSDDKKATNTSIITGSSIKKLIPASIPSIQTKKTAASSAVATPSTKESCSVNICFNANMKEIYCQLSYAECCKKYTGCRIISCDDGTCDTADVEEEETASADEYETEDSSAEGSSCNEDYHDCFDNGEAVICKGDFESCSASFQDCVCGTGSDVSADGEQAKAEIDTSETDECGTGVYVCDRQVLTMSGNVAASTVTCKGTFQRCALIYGNCQCGNSTLTDFPTKYIGSAGNDTVCANADSYWCDYDGRQVPCYMLPGNCTKKKNTCENTNGMKINCDGSIDYCNKKYGGTCLCGIEATTSGFMVTKAD